MRRYYYDLASLLYTARASLPVTHYIAECWIQTKYTHFNTGGILLNDTIGRYWITMMVYCERSTTLPLTIIT